MKKHIDLPNNIPNLKANEKMVALSDQLIGLNHSEWEQLKVIIDDIFHTKVAKIKLDDSDKVKQRLEFEFSGFNKLEKAILLSSLNKDTNKG